MVKLREIIAFLESTIPLELQDSWDNSGLQVGWDDQEVKRAGFALSVSREVISAAKEESLDLIITHHPLTISGLKVFSPYLYPQNLLLELVKNSISLYALHTNLDVSPFGPTAIISEFLDLRETEPIVQKPPYGLIGKLPEEVSQEELFQKLKELLPADVFRVVNYHSSQPVSTVAVCSGSGASFIDAVAGRVDLYITGDVKYHDAMKAKDLGLTVFDMGHFGTERLFYRKLKKLLESTFPQVDFILLPEKSPFEVV